MKRSAPTNVVFIGKLSSRVREDDLRDEFRRYGRIRDVDFRRHRGFAFIEYNSSSDARAAVEEMDGQRFEDTRIVVQFKEGKGDKDRRGPSNVDVCYNCGRKGHCFDGEIIERRASSGFVGAENENGRILANECKEAHLGYRNKCYRCGKPGHLKKDCSLSRTPSSRRDSPKRNNKKSSRRRDSRSRNRSESKSKSRSRSRDRKRKQSVSKSSSRSSRSRSRSSKRSSSSSRSSSRSNSSRKSRKSNSRSRSKKPSSPSNKNATASNGTSIPQDSQIPRPTQAP